MTTFSIVLPTLNAESYIEKLIRRLFLLSGGTSAEIIIIDSASQDKTIQIIETLNKEYSNLRYYPISRSKFNHGLTRNLGVALARGKYVCFVSQDAYPTSKNTLKYFLEDFALSKRVVAVYAKDTPADEVANFLKLEHFCRYRPLDRLAGGKPLLQTKEDGWRYTQKVNYYGLSNVFSCYKKSFLFKHPFVKVSFGEDLLAGKLIIETGLAKVYDPRPHVIHHQKINLYDYFRRQKSDLDLRLVKMQLKDKPQIYCKLKGIYFQKGPISKKIYYAFELAFYYLVKLLAYL